MAQVSPDCHGRARYKAELARRRFVAVEHQEIFLAAEEEAGIECCFKLVQEYDGWWLGTIEYWAGKMRSTAYGSDSQRLRETPSVGRVIASQAHSRVLLSPASRLPHPRALPRRGQLRLCHSGMSELRGRSTQQGHLRKNLLQGQYHIQSYASRREFLAGCFCLRGRETSAGRGAGSLQDPLFFQQEKSS